MPQQWPPELGTDTNTPEPQQITRTDCPKCGAEVFGIDGRYACPLCAWVNHWSEGHGPLPVAEDDPDWPGRDGPDNRLTR